MTLAIIDLQIEAVAAALFGVAVLTEREILGLDFGTEAESAEVALI